MADGFQRCLKCKRILVKPGLRACPHCGQRIGVTTRRVAPQSPAPRDTRRIPTGKTSRRIATGRSTARLRAVAPGRRKKQMVLWFSLGGVGAAGLLAIILVGALSGGGNPAGPTPTPAPAPTPIVRPDPTPTPVTPTPSPTRTFDQVLADADRQAASLADDAARIQFWREFRDGNARTNSQRLEIDSRINAVREGAEAQVQARRDAAFAGVRDSLRAGRYDDALAALDAIDPALLADREFAREADDLRDRIDGARRWAAFRTEIEAMADAAEKLRAIRDFDTTGLPDEALAELRAIEARLRDYGWFESLASRRSDGRRAAQERVDRIRTLIDEEHAARETRRTEAIAALRAETEVRPLQFDMAGTLASGGVITSLDGGRIVIRFQVNGVESEFTWSAAQLPPELARRVPRLLIQHLHPADLFEAAREAIVHRGYDVAQEMIADAVGREPRLAPFAPDLAPLRTGTISFRGEVSRERRRMRILYSFDAEDQAQDWQAAEGVAARVASGRLQIASRERLALATLREFQAAGTLEVRVAPGPASSETAHAIYVQTSGDDPHGIAVNWRTDQGQCQILRLADGIRWEEATDWINVARASSVTLVLSPERCLVRAGNSDGPAIEGWTASGEMTVSLGALGSGVVPQNVAEFEEVEITGDAHMRWLQKILAEENHLIAQALARSELPAGWSRESVGEPPAREDLYATEYDLILDQLPQGIRDGRRRVEQYLEGIWSGEVDPWTAIQMGERTVESMVQSSPDLALGYYYRALYLRFLGDYFAGCTDLDAALERDPEFAEAAILLAQMRRAMGEDEASLAAIDRATELRPDAAEMFLWRAWLRFYNRQREPAMADLGWVSALRPSEALAQSAFRLRTVLRGPPWLRRFERQTDHYVLATDISDRVAERYAEILEAVRPVYEGVVGPAEAGELKPEVFVFNTSESYYAYALVTLNDRLEHTLGLFHPEYKQLLVIDDPDEEQTMQTLAHEGFHQYLDLIIPNAPPWFNEGMAEYVGASRVVRGRVEETGGVVQMRVPALRYCFDRSIGLPTFPQLTQLGYEYFQSEWGPILYAQAWSWIHFLKHGENGANADRLRRYSDALRDGESMRQAYETAFGDADFDALEPRWREYVRAWW